MAKNKWQSKKYQQENKDRPLVLKEIEKATKTAVT